MFKFVIEKNKLKDIGELVRAEAGEKAYQAASMAAQEMREEMQKTKTGQTYQRGQKGKRGRNKLRVHVASAPGEAPSIDYGHLINTIRVRRKSDSSEVAVNSDAALPLEFGTKRMAARPFFGPATKRAGEWYFQQLRMLKL